MDQNIFWIPGPWKGRLAVAPRPRGGEWLPDEIRAWRNQKINSIVSLLAPTEIREFKLEDEKSSADREKIQFFHISVQDRDVPDSKRVFLRFAESILLELESGKNVVIHCRQGIGRSGLLAAALFMLSGENLGEAIEQISRARGVPIPETDEQREWLRQISEMISGEDKLRLRA